MLLHLPRQGVQIASPRVWGEPLPFRQSSARGLYSRINVRRGTLRDRCQWLARRRIRRIASARSRLLDEAGCAQAESHEMLRWIRPAPDVSRERVGVLDRMRAKLGHSIRPCLAETHTSDPSTASHWHRSRKVPRRTLMRL